MQVVDLPEIEAAFDPARAMAAIEEGFVRFSAGQVQLTAVGHLRFAEADGDCHVKGGYVEGDEIFVVKVATGFYRNSARGLPSSNGFMSVTSAATGEPLALLLDRGWLTDVRTAMAGAIAGKRILRSSSRTLGIVGTGIQAEFQARFVADACNLKSILVWGRNVEASERLCERLSDRGYDATVAADLAELCTDSDLIVTATNSSQPVIKDGMIEAGTRIVAVGADSPGKCELDPAIVARADLVVVDSRKQCLDHGEIQHAAAQGSLATERLIELGELLAQPERNIAEESIVIVDLTGLGVQDAQIAKSVWQKLQSAG